MLLPDQLTLSLLWIALVAQCEWGLLSSTSDAYNLVLRWGNFMFMVIVLGI